MASGDPVGHASGRRIVAILDKPMADIQHTAWAGSLRNRGHDPLE